MKRLIVLSMLTSLLGCNDKEEIVECDAIYDTVFIVDNETDKEITVSNDYPYTIYGDRDVALLFGESEVIYGRSGLGPCDNETLLEDKLQDDFLIPFGGMPEYSFTMTIDGEEVSSEIWLRKYWSFTPDYYSWTYTLTVTDELLSELADKKE